MNLYRVLPDPPGLIPFDAPQEQAAFAATLAPQSLPWIRAVMVANSAGETLGPTGTSAGLTRGADRALLRLYREAADVVLVGASTLRAERVPTPRNAALAIVSASGELRGHQLVVRENARVCVITTPHGASAAAQALGDIEHTVLIIDSEAPFSAKAIHAVLQTWCLSDHLVIEGGKALWETFAEWTMELCLAVTPPPLDHHGGIPEWWPGDSSHWTLLSVLSDDEKMLYYRYLVHPSGAPLGSPAGASPILKK